MYSQTTSTKMNLTAKYINPNPNPQQNPFIERKTLFEKDGLQIEKISNKYQQKYDIQFILENPNMILTNIVNFDLVNLLYALNKDIYEQAIIENVNENEAIITVVMKNLFEDIGLPQYYYHINMKKRFENNQYVFDSQSIDGKKPDNIPANTELLDIENFSIKSTVLTPHKIHFSFSIVFKMNISAIAVFSSFSDKLLVIMLQKIYKRLKQFIEKAVKNV